MFRFTLGYALALYTLLAIVLFPHVKWYVDNPDSFQYLFLSHRYADGSFLHVLNGYWSPLIIWLLVLPLKIFSHGVIAFKVLQLVIGGVTLVLWHRLLMACKLSPVVQALLVAAAIPILLARSMLTLTPDLLFITISLALLYMLITGSMFGSWKKAMTFGFLGALLYFSKAFGFPLFLAILVIVVILEVKRGPIGRAKIIRTAGVSLAAFLLITGPWVAVLSANYGHFTISEAARYNQSVEVAPMPEEFIFLPLLTGGLYTPPHYAVSPWEVPGDLIDLTPLRPWTDPYRYARLIQRNLLSIYYYDFRRQLGTPFVLILLGTILLRGWRPVLTNRNILHPLLLMLALDLGYSLILVNDRYIWLNTFLMLLMCAVLLAELLPRQGHARAMIMLGLILLTIKRPVKEILFTEDADVSGSEFVEALSDPLGTLERSYHPDHMLMAAIRQLKTMNIAGPAASIQGMIPVRGDYSASLQIAYDTGWRYHGSLPLFASSESRMNELQAHGIRCMIVFDDVVWQEGELLLQTEPRWLRVYKLDPE